MKFRHVSRWIWPCLAMIGLPGGPVMAQGGPVNPPLSLPLDVGHSEVVRSGPRITKVSVTDPTIADVAVLDGHSVLVNGKKAGSTHCFVWTESGMTRYEVSVRLDASLLRETITQVTGARDLKVQVVQDTVLLTGRVARTSQAQQAEKLAQGFAPRVVNLLEADTVQQVQVDVQVVELGKTASHELGIKWGQMTRSSNGEDRFEPDHMGMSQADARNPRSGLPLSDLGGTAFGLYERIAARLNLLVSQGEARVLARPKLVAVSGGKASFLAGGEVPVPVSQQLSQVTFEWKPYGIKLDIAPQVLEDGRVSLQVAPEVSQLDFPNAVRLANFVVPAISTRRAQTQVVLRQGQGLAIGGLLQDVNSQLVEKVPFLGDLPILGELFRSTRYQRQETELAILVTPTVLGPEPDVAPSLSPSPIPAPTSAPTPIPTPVPTPRR